MSLLHRIITLAFMLHKMHVRYVPDRTAVTEMLLPTLNHYAIISPKSDAWGVRQAYFFEPDIFDMGVRMFLY